MEDVRNELVSIERAREDYGVIIDPVSLAVDSEATRQRRGERS
jgi:N-methylhydantoinase B